MRILHGIGYTILRVNKSDNAFLNLIELPNIEVHSDLNNCEYVMMPNAKMELVKDCVQRCV